MEPTTDRTRFEVPLYTVAEAARVVAVPPSTLATWAKGYSPPLRRPGHRDRRPGRDVPTERSPGGPMLALRRARRGARPLCPAAKRGAASAIRPALAHLQKEIGLDHALASRRLYTDGAELLFDYGESHAGTPDGAAARTLVDVRRGQRVFADVVHDYLRRIDYGADGYASLIHVPAYGHAQVVADPSRSFGAPIFERGGARVDDVLQRSWAGDSLDALSAEFGVPVDQLEDVLRVASRRAA